MKLVRSWFCPLLKQYPRWSWKQKIVSLTNLHSLLSFPILTKDSNACEEKYVWFLSSSSKPNLAMQLKDSCRCNPNSSWLQFSLEKDDTSRLPWAIRRRNMKKFFCILRAILSHQRNKDEIQTLINLDVHIYKTTWKFYFCYIWSMQYKVGSIRGGGQAFPCGYECECFISE